MRPCGDRHRGSTTAAKEGQAHSQLPCELTNRVTAASTTTLAPPNLIVACVGSDRSRPGGHGATDTPDRAARRTGAVSGVSLSAGAGFGVARGRGGWEEEDGGTHLK